MNTVNENELIKNAILLLEKHGYKVEKSKYDFIPKKNKTLSFEDAARIVNKKYEKTFEYLKNN